MAKKVRRNKSDLGDDFIAPDGGNWSWLICIVGGLSNMCILPILQSFGLIYRGRLIKIGLTNSQITTIINTTSAISFSTGLLNGPMFRRFSFRQVALFGAAVSTIGIFLSSMAYSFITYLLSFSIVFGFGSGISMSSTSLAINTYFKEKRRRANSFAWAITGTSTIFVPHIVNGLMSFYGVQGTILLFSAISMHTFACGLLYQPVRWHTKKPVYQNEIEPIQQVQQATEITHSNNKMICSSCHLEFPRRRQRKSTGLFSSLDELQITGYEILEPGTPILTRANNDGWYGSKYSISCSGGGGTGGGGGRRSRLNSINAENRHKKLSNSENDSKSLRPNQILENFLKIKDSGKCLCEDDNAEKIPLNLIHQKPDEILIANENENLQTDEIQIDKKLKWYQRVVIFFDLDLLKDLKYLNLMIGLTLTSFSEINFSILTPFILIDFGFTSEQVAVAMSLLGLADVIVRFLIPFVTDILNVDNMIIYVIGIIGLVLGRIVVSQIPSFNVLLMAFMWMGICKAIRTVFMGLIIPSYIQLNRLPAAAGLQLMSAGLFALIGGPIVGLISDATNYSVTVNFLNVIAMICVISWTISIICRARNKNPIKEEC